MENKIINYGIISTASIAHRFAKAVNDTNNSKAIAISSRDLNKAKDFASKYQIENYCDDYHRILENNNIDAVYIPLINSLHYSFAKEALLANKHVLLEKPFTLHSFEAIDLMNIAKERNLFLTETVKTVFLPVLIDVKKIIDSKEYGDIKYMEFKQSYVSGDYISGWNKQKQFGGGVLYGNQAYFLTVSEYLAGDVVSINGLPSYTTNDVEDQIALSMLMQNGSLATVCVSTNILFNNGLTIYLDKARIEIPDYWKARKAFIYQDNQLIQEINYPCDNELMYEIMHYSDCILKGLIQSPITPLDKTIKHIEICENLIDKWENPLINN